MPPALKQADASQPGTQSQQSKENTPLPDADAAGKASLVGSSQVVGTGSSLQDTRTLAESFNLLRRYGEEFMDEHPLVGEPGSFILSRVNDTDRTSAAKPPAPAAKVGTPQVRVDTPGKVSEKGATPSGSEESKMRKKKTKVGS